jgi:hypothetical protein
MTLTHIDSHPPRQNKNWKGIARMPYFCQVLPGWAFPDLIPGTIFLFSGQVFAGRLCCLHS